MDVFFFILLQKKSDFTILTLSLLSTACLVAMGPLTICCESLSVHDFLFMFLFDVINCYFTLQAVSNGLCLVSFSQIRFIFGSTTIWERVSFKNNYIYLSILHIIRDLFSIYTIIDESQVCAHAEKSHSL
jgi:hypothetical protein